MKVLFATGNQAKVKRYKESLEKNGIELITIKDIGINLNIDENGKDAIENAYIKAKAYYDATGIPTIGMDNNLFIDGIDESLQPGTHVRRVGGRQLSDEEMITYYTRLVKDHGEKLQAKWVYGMVVITDKSCDELTWSKDKFYFVSTPCSRINPGYPLDSISIISEFNKYLVELSDEERNLYKSKENIDGVVNFILYCINKSKEI